ncbi:MAG: FecR domain-containing protein [Balneolaceae bacterium]|nr:FecR domain-containing protein [Balneolaceae bacterium]
MKQSYKILCLGLVCFSFLGLELKDVLITEERPLAIVRRFKPTVAVQNQAVDKDLILSLEENLGEKLFDGDTLMTDDKGYALVVFMDESVAKVKPNSMLIVRGDVSNDVKSMNTRINLENGEIFLNVQPQGSNDFEVATSRSLASVKGTNFGNTAGGYVWVEEGQVDLTALNSGQTVSLYDKMFGQVDQQGNNVDTGELTDRELQDLNEGYSDLDNDLERKTIKLRFRDENGQVRVIEVVIFEEGQN